MSKMLNNISSRYTLLKCTYILILKYADHIRGCYQANQNVNNNVPSNIANHPLVHTHTHTNNNNNNNVQYEKVAVDYKMIKYKW